MYYGPDIMQKAGIKIPSLDTKSSALVLNIPLSFLNAVGTIASIFFIDKLGRRYLILRTTPFVALCWFVTATGMALTRPSLDEETQTVGGIVACLGLSFFLLFFAFGMSSTPWTINAEIYPLHVIGTANSLSATTNWLVNAFVSYVFKILTEISITAEVIVYICLGFMAILCFFFTYKFIPETANKPIKDILESILGKNYKKEERTRLR